MDPLVPLPNINLTNLTKVYSFSALIVVLVILAGVAINMTIGENGIITRAAAVITKGTTM